jgi:hypothetical protein
MEETEAEIAFILASCKTEDQLRRQLTKHATIVQKLICRIDRENHHAEQAIRTLYSTFADMAVEQLKDQRLFPGKKPN